MQADRESTSISAFPSMATGAARPTRIRMLVLALACGLSFLLYLHRYTWGFVRREVGAEFGWDSVTLGWLDSLFTATYAPGQIPSGILCDWFGARLLLGASTLLWSLALAGTALATGLLSMGAARLAFGAAQASCYPVLSKASKNWFPLTMRPLAQGLIATLCGRGGGAACFLVFGGLLLGYLQVPWRVAVMLLAGLGIVAGILFVVLFRNSPRVHPWANDAEANLVTHGDPEAAFTTRSRLNWRALLRNRSAQLLCTRSVLSNLADVLYVYWLPTYLRSILDVSAVSTGWMAALPLIGGALGGVASGGLQSYMMRRTGSRRWSRAAIGMAGKGIAGMLMLAVLGLQDAASIALLLLAVKFFCDWEQSAEWGVTGDLGGRSAATLFACINTAGAIGGFIAGPLNGYVLQSYSENGVPTAEGWNVLFVLIALEYLAAALCWLGIDGRTPLAPAEDRG